MMFDVTAIGELLIDFTPAGTNENGIVLFARNPGGAPANVLAANSRLGGKTAFIGKVGTDGFGQFLKDTLINTGIDVDGLVIPAGALLEEQRCRAEPEYACKLGCPQQSVV